MIKSKSLVASVALFLVTIAGLSFTTLPSSGAEDFVAVLETIVQKNQYRNDPSWRIVTKDVEKQIPIGTKIEDARALIEASAIQNKSKYYWTKSLETKYPKSFDSRFSFRIVSLSAINPYAYDEFQITFKIKSGRVAGMFAVIKDIGP